MARRPFFSGNYGSALGSFDTAAKLIAQAGQTQGQAMANIGSQVGGMIEQYGLNKEKQKKADARIKSALNSMGEFVEAGVLSPENKTRAEEFLNDPNRSSAEKVVFIEEQEKMFFQVPKAQLAKSQALNAKLEADFAKADEENRSLRSTLETESMQTLNKYKDLQLEILGLERDMKSNERDIDREKKYAELEQLNLALDSLREDIESKRNSNSVFAEQLERERTKSAVDISQAMSRLAINAEELDQLRASRDVDQKTKEENLKILQSERNKLELDLKNKQKLMQLYSSDSTEENLDFIKEIDIDDSFQGGPLFGKDAAGLFYNIVGGLGSVFGADITPETTGQAQNLLTLETFLLPALVSDISSRPSNFTLKVARQKIPLPSDRDDVGQRKIEALIPDLKLRLKEAQNTLASGETDKPYYQEARTQESRIRKIIPILENSLKEKSPSPFSGTTSTNVKYRILGKK